MGTSSRRIIFTQRSNRMLYIYVYMYICIYIYNIYIYYIYILYIYSNMHVRPFVRPFVRPSVNLPVRRRVCPVRRSILPSIRQYTKLILSQISSVFDLCFQGQPFKIGCVFPIAIKRIHLEDDCLTQMCTTIKKQRNRDGQIRANSSSKFFIVKLKI